MNLAYKRNLEEVLAQSPRLPASGLPWVKVGKDHQPRRGLWLSFKPKGTTPSALIKFFPILTRGSFFVATLGFVPQPLRKSRQKARFRATPPKWF